MGISIVKTEMNPCKTCLVQRDEGGVITSQNCFTVQYIKQLEDISQILGLCQARTVNFILVKPYWKSKCLI